MLYRLSLLSFLFLVGPAVVWGQNNGDCFDIWEIDVSKNDLAAGNEFADYKYAKPVEFKKDVAGEQYQYLVSVYTSFKEGEAPRLKYQVINMEDGLPFDSNENGTVDEEELSGYSFPNARLPDSSTYDPRWIADPVVVGKFMYVVYLRRIDGKFSIVLNEFTEKNSSTNEVAIDETVDPYIDEGSLPALVSFEAVENNQAHLMFAISYISGNTVKVALINYSKGEVEKVVEIDKPSGIPMVVRRPLIYSFGRFVQGNLVKSRLLVLYSGFSYQSVTDKLVGGGLYAASIDQDGEVPYDSKGFNSWNEQNNGAPVLMPGSKNLLLPRRDDTYYSIQDGRDKETWAANIVFKRVKGDKEQLLCTAIDHNGQGIKSDFGSSIIVAEGEIVEFMVRKGALERTQKEIWHDAMIYYIEKNSGLETPYLQTVYVDHTPPVSEFNIRSDGLLKLSDPMLNAEIAGFVTGVNQPGDSLSMCAGWIDSEGRLNIRYSRSGSGFKQSWSEILSSSYNVKGEPALLFISDGEDNNAYVVAMWDERRDAFFSGRDSLFMQLVNDNGVIGGEFAPAKQLAFEIVENLEGFRDEIVLEWNYNTKTPLCYIEEFRVVWAIGNNPLEFEVLDSIEAKKFNSYIISLSDLEEGKIYNYNVRAVNNNGDIASAAGVQLNSPKFHRSFISHHELQAVDDIVGTGKNITIYLRFKHYSSAEFMVLERSFNNGAFKGVLAAQKGDDFVDQQLEKGVYLYRLKVGNGSNFSEYSNIVTINASDLVTESPSGKGSNSVSGLGSKKKSNRPSCPTSISIEHQEGGSLAGISLLLCSFIVTLAVAGRKS